jgi:hypothetical protein
MPTSFTSCFAKRRSQLLPVLCGGLWTLAQLTPGCATTKLMAQTAPTPVALPASAPAKEPHALSRYQLAAFANECDQNAKTAILAGYREFAKDWEKRRDAALAQMKLADSLPTPSPSPRPTPKRHHKHTPPRRRIKEESAPNPSPSPAQSPVDTSEQRWLGPRFNGP